MASIRRLAALVLAALMMPSAGYADDAVVTTPSAAPAPTAEPSVGADKPSVIYKPPWKKQPSLEQFQKTYPARALRQNIQGRAEMACIVGKDGSMTKCIVTLETPEGYGFGATALKLSKRFTMYTTTPDGVSTAGATVKIAIPFRLQ